MVPTSDCRFNCHGMIYVSEGKLIVTNFQLLAPLVLGGAPIFKPRRGGNCPPPPPPPGPPLATTPLPDTHAPSYATIAVAEAGAVANQEERKKQLKYAHLGPGHIFTPIAIEPSGVFGTETLKFLNILVIALNWLLERAVHTPSSFKGFQ